MVLFASAIAAALAASVGAAWFVAGTGTPIADEPQPKPAASDAAPFPPIEINARISGTLSVNAVPWARIFVDGRPLGQTPRSGLSLPVGSHTLKLVTGGGETRTKTVQISAGRETRVTVDFSQP
jgi:serine/threonine-protein kinase